MVPYGTEDIYKLAHVLYVYVVSRLPLQLVPFGHELIRQ